MAVLKHRLTKFLKIVIIRSYKLECANAPLPEAKCTVYC